MSYFIFLIFFSMVVGIIVGKLNEDECVGEVVFFGLLFIGVLISMFSMRIINYNDFGTSLKLVINEEITNDELRIQIEDLIEYESDGKAFDIVVNVEDMKVSNLNTKKVKLKTKLPVITDKLFITNNKEFKIIIKDEEIKNSSIEIIGLGEN